jgi:hypothetical protein
MALSLNVATGFGVPAPSSPVSESVTIGLGSHTAMFVIINLFTLGSFNTNPITSLSVTYAGVSLTPANFLGSTVPGCIQEVLTAVAGFWIVAPTTGPNNLVITYASGATVSYMGINVIACNGVDPTMPLGNHNTDGAPSGTLTSPLNVMNGDPGTPGAWWITAVGLSYNTSASETAPNSAKSQPSGTALTTLQSIQFGVLDFVYSFYSQAWPSGDNYENAVVYTTNPAEFTAMAFEIVAQPAQSQGKTKVFDTFMQNDETPLIENSQFLQEV